MPKSPPKRVTWYSVALIAAPVAAVRVVGDPRPGDPNLIQWFQGIGRQIASNSHPEAAF